MADDKPQASQGIVPNEYVEIFNAYNEAFEHFAQYAKNLKKKKEQNGKLTDQQEIILHKYDIAEYALVQIAGRNYKLSLETPRYYKNSIRVEDHNDPNYGKDITIFESPPLDGILRFLEQRVEEMEIETEAFRDNVDEHKAAQMLLEKYKKDYELLKKASEPFRIQTSIEAHPDIMRIRIKQEALGNTGLNKPREDIPQDVWEKAEKEITEREVLSLPPLAGEERPTTLIIEDPMLELEMAAEEIRKRAEQAKGINVRKAIAALGTAMAYLLSREGEVLEEEKTATSEKKEEQKPSEKKADEPREVKPQPEAKKEEEKPVEQEKKDEQKKEEIQPEKKDEKIEEKKPEEIEKKVETEETKEIKDHEQPSFKTRVREVLNVIEPLRKQVIEQEAPTPEQKPEKAVEEQKAQETGTPLRPNVTEENFKMPQMTLAPLDMTDVLTQIPVTENAKQEVQDARPVVSENSQSTDKEPKESGVLSDQPLVEQENEPEQGKKTDLIPETPELTSTQTTNDLKPISINEYDVKDGQTNKEIAKELLTKTVNEAPDSLIDIVAYANSGLNGRLNPDFLPLGPMTRLSDDVLKKLHEKYKANSKDEIFQTFDKLKADDITAAVQKITSYMHKLS